ncbi:MAG: shikimate dehydrogenase [Bacteroidales bacterium]|nr:shikimate dehydrogenase [Bacteroidales bacterium]
MLFGLIGKSLKHSYSKILFENKFSSQYSYLLFELESIEMFPTLLEQHNDILGLNVTIPYKTAIIPYLSKLDNKAKNINAVNTLLIKNGNIIGFNTDIIGFEKAYNVVLEKKHTLALILGTGGASKAVSYVLKRYKIPYLFVSRNKFSEDTVLYSDIMKMNISVSLVINSTPIGMYPNVDEMPFIPDNILYQKPVVIDLIYNPEKTKFLQKAEIFGCSIFNGIEMLKLQAYESWKIWGLQ